SNYNITFVPGSLSVSKSDTSVALQVSSGNISLSDNVTLTATVSAVSPGSGTPTGTVTFMDGTTTLGTGTVGANGVATLTKTGTDRGAGSHSITAVYGSDVDFNASPASAASIVVVNAVNHPPVIDITGPTKGVRGQEMSFTFTVTDQDSTDVTA